MMDRLKRSAFRLYWLKILIRALFLITLLGSTAKPVFAQEIPAGFILVAEQQGVALYRKDYPNGTPDYVQIVDLTQGASVDLLYGAPVAMNNQRNQGMFGGPNPSFRQKAIRSYWDEYSSSQAGAFCVTNGQFFYMPESPTPLALPLLVDHQLLAEGFGFPQYPEKQLMLALWPNHADILPLTAENLAGTTAESVIGGLTEEANKKPKNAVGRTFMGIWDKDGDLLYETIAIYTTRTATQAEAAATVRSFGASKVMMLDGGGSTQIICQGQTYIDTTRAIPQAIGVSSGTGEISALESQAVESGQTIQPEIAASPEAAGRVAASPESIESIAVSPEVTGIIAASPESVESLAVSPEVTGYIAASPEAAAQELTGSDAASNPSLPAAANPVAPIETPGDAALAAQPSSAEETAPQVEAVAQASALVTASMSLPSAGIVQDALIPTGAEVVAQLSTSLTAASQSALVGQPASSDRANGLDVLWLPAIISPLSLVLFYIARRHVSLLYRA
jgi:Phosphodiester glycosidase